MIDPTLLGSYARRLAETLPLLPLGPIEELVHDFARVRREGRAVWICGNGGSAANAIHWANDFVYPVVKRGGTGVRIQALTANPSVLTCLGNDIGYDLVFARQLETFGTAGDVLVALSGSGNSPNILRGIEQARGQGIKSFAVLGFDGGKAKGLADTAIHIPTQDMQVAEDLQMVICHMVVQCLEAAFRI